MAPVKPSIRSLLRENLTFRVYFRVKMRMTGGIGLWLGLGLMPLEAACCHPLWLYSVAFYERIISRERIFQNSGIPTEMMAGDINGHFIFAWTFIIAITVVYALVTISYCCCFCGCFKYYSIHSGQDVCDVLINTQWICVEQRGRRNKEN